MEDKESCIKFGDEINMINNIIKGAEKYGAGASFWKKLEKYPELFENIIGFIETVFTTNCSEEAYGDMIIYDNIIYHRKHRDILWRPHEYEIELLELNSSISDKDLKKYLELKSVANLNLRNWLYCNTAVIPDDWKSKQICFLGTILCGVSQPQTFDHYCVMVIRYTNARWEFGRETLCSIIESKTPWYMVYIV